MNPTGSATQSPREIAPLWRWVGIGVVVARFAIPLAAVPFIYVLARDNVALLVLLRPQKEFLLLGGAQTRYLGEPGVLPLFLAFLPLGILSVSAFFLVGRIYRPSLLAGEGPGWLHRTIPPRQLDIARSVLARRGPVIAVLGRVAAMPPTVLGAAAGISEVGARRYLLADALGAIIAFTMTVGAGLALGRAYEEQGIWLTAAGVVVFLVLVGLLTGWIRREAERHDAGTTPA